MVHYGYGSTATSATTEVVWGAWCETGTACTTDATWTVWTQASASTETTTAVWVRWNEGTATTVARPVYSYSYQPPKLSKEEQAKLEAELAERAEKERLRAEKVRLEREAADKRAEELLFAHLDKIQTAQYRKEKKFTVRSKDGADFELQSLWSGNAVEMTPDGKRLARFCIHPAVIVPIPDLLLSQKLMLETDPAAFRRIANKTELAGAT